MLSVVAAGVGYLVAIPLQRQNRSIKIAAALSGLITAVLISAYIAQSGTHKSAAVPFQVLGAVFAVSVFLGRKRG